MDIRVRSKLIQIARNHLSPISFPVLIQEMDLGLNLDRPYDKSRLNEILHDISMDEHEEGRPLLSCLVKTKTNKGQGDEFFKLCEELGMGEWRALKNDPEFLEDQRRQCYEFWSNEENYQKYL
ncbi:hypothetical protein BH23BAC1_BH23BAC1_04940 [soil metagenome]